MLEKPSRLASGPSFNASENAVESDGMIDSDIYQDFSTVIYGLMTELMLFVPKRRLLQGSY